MLTWRYHLLSLVAVFLALGLGVLVGISLSDNGAVTTGQDRLVEEIQQDVDNLHTRNGILEREQAVNQRFLDDSFPFVVGGHLQGKKIALVVSNKAGDDIQRKVTSAIHAAGGQVASTTVLNARLDPLAVAGKLKAELKGEPQWATANDTNTAALLGPVLAREIGRGGAARALPLLQGIAVDSVSGSYDQPVDWVVLVTRADDEQSPAFSELEKSFLLGLKELGVMPAGCEPQDAVRSEIPLFLSVDVSSVDNIDSRIGQVSLVFVLGGEKGAFGVKPTADMLIPILRNPKPAAPLPAT